jgi:hypothetical protein
VPPNQKVTLAEMRSAGVRGVLIYCADFRCSHHVAVLADRWADEVRLSDLEPQVRLHRLRQARWRNQAGLSLEQKAGCHDGLSLIGCSQLA